MNNKGFTLVELLAVIVILALLALLTSTSVTKLVKDSKDDLYDAQINLIKAAAESWGADNLISIPTDGSCMYLTLDDLIGYGLLDSDIKNPKTKQPFVDLKVEIYTVTNEGYDKPVVVYFVDHEELTEEEDNGIECTTPVY